jgi:uncharacterized membrane protein
VPVPLHPALVHLPLGLAFILPLLAAGFAWALWKERANPRTWSVIVALQLMLLIAGFMALRSGRGEEGRVEDRIPETALETHEEYAEQFLWATGLTLALAGTALVVRKKSLVKGLTAVTVLGTLAVAGAAIRVGHAGGKLVYVHNAAAAYITSPQTVVANDSAKSTEVKSGGTTGDADDGD